MMRRRPVPVQFPRAVMDAPEAVAGQGPERFVLHAGVGALTRRRRPDPTPDTAAALRAAAGLWAAYDEIPGDPAGIVAYVRAHRP